MGGILIEEDLYVKHRIVHPNTPDGQKIHAFFLARAKALAGKYIDFDKTPITFLLSDDDEPNAFFMRVYDPQKRPRHDDYKTIRSIRNPLPTPVICFTRGLIELADNLDHLDFVLGHELTHRILRLDKGIKVNSKGEECMAETMKKEALEFLYRHRNAVTSLKTGIDFSLRNETLDSDTWAEILVAFLAQEEIDQPFMNLFCRLYEVRVTGFWESIIDVDNANTEALLTEQAEKTRDRYLTYLKERG